MPTTMQTHNQTPRRHLSTIKATALAALMGILPAQAGDTFKWTVQYLVDNSQEVLGESQRIWPRGNRGIALSPDGASIYTGYNHGSGEVGEVRKIAIGVSDDFAKATVGILHGPLGKALACDDKGHVYIANNSEVLIYDANLSTPLLSVLISTSQGVRCEGLAVVREGNELALYASNRNGGTVHRIVMEEKDGAITGYKAAGFDGSGVVNIPTAQDLRGIEVDAKGQIWAADNDGGRVYRVSKDGKDIKELSVPSALDVAVEGNRAYVSRGRDRLVAVVDTDSLSLLGNLAIPWDELELTPTGNNHKGAVGGIVSIPGKGFFVTNETGQTAHQKSTYGKVDANSDKVGSAVYRDAFLDDNDPILRALEVKE